MTSKALTPKLRRQSLVTVAADGVDVLVIGGGVTGAGIAVDAATRGLSVALVEAQDWASGTSSRSSKLVHGGLRYLEMLDFQLVHEALRERDLLLSYLAPHLVRPVSFLYPLEHRVWERAYVGAGVTLYDAMAATFERRSLPAHRHISMSGLHELFPDLKEDAAIGAIRYWDAVVDDARLVLTLVRTAARHGAHVISRARVEEINRDDDGIVNGVRLFDLEEEQSHQIRARHVINATGVWTQETEALAGATDGLEVLASKGAHIVVPLDRIDGETGIIMQTEKSVLFIIPSDRYWIIGTTDTPWNLGLSHPVATRADINYLLDHANRILQSPLTLEDVIGSFAGLRPLLQPTDRETSSTKVSREHTVASPMPGLTVIAGGKLTTYRVMAQDAVDMALGDEADDNPSVTKETPLIGALSGGDIRTQRKAIVAGHGWDRIRANHLLSRYGALLPELLELMESDPSLAAPLVFAPDYLRAEIVYAATHESVLRLEDVMLHRTRLSYEVRDRGLGAVPEILDLIAGHLGWDSSRRVREGAAYTARCEGEAAAALVDTDQDAERARSAAESL